MNFKTIAAASVIACLPMTSFAAVDVSLGGVDPVLADAVTLVGTGPATDFTADALDVLNNSYLWDMNVQGTAGAANTGGIVDFDFSLTQSADITLTSTAILPGNLKDLAIELLQGGNSLGVATYSAGGFYAALTATASAGTLTVRSYWDSVAGPLNKANVDFVLQAANFGGTDIPLPASAFLLVGALGGLGLLARRRA